MKLVVATTLMILLPVTASAATIGDKACADAEVIAFIRDQAWSRVYDVHIEGIAPKSIPLNGDLKINLDVEKVIYGPITPGKVDVAMMARSVLNPRYRRLRVFLEQTPARNWWVANCDYKF
jgi:hypothetical protein